MSNNFPPYDICASPDVPLEGGTRSPGVEWIYIGIFTAKRLDIDINEWRKVITDRKVLADILS